MASELPQDSVLAQRGGATSIYRLYRRLIDLRRKCPALSLGGFGSDRAEGNLLVFTREHGRERLLVALNFGGTPVASRRMHWPAARIIRRRSCGRAGA